MPVETPDLFWLLGKEVLDCICFALDAESTCPCPCNACVIIGDPVYDDCCEGQLTVGLNRLYVHDNFPSAAAGPIFCSSPLAGDFTVTLLRCAPTVKEDGTPPSCEELSASARSILSEFYIAFRAVICCLAAKKRHQKFLMRDARTIGPEGGCVGFELRFTVEIPDPPV